MTTKHSTLNFSHEIFQLKNYSVCTLHTQSGGQDPPKPISDAYDRAVRELAFERRGRPTERMKSEEEEAREEREKLEKLEVRRCWMQSGTLCWY